MACSALIAAVAFGAWLLRPGSSSEKAHPNWERAAAAQEATLTDGAARLVRVDAAGAEQLASELLFDVNDLDAETTETVRRAVQGGDVEGATQALRDAQVVSDRGAGAVEVAADLAEDSNLASAIEQGRVRFFRMDVFDCCVEDGDVVELVVNGVPFASVPMTHAGATLSVPLAPGRNELVIRGVQDGGGGITIAFTTSRGDFYCGSLTAGEEILLGVVAP